MFFPVDPLNGLKVVTDFDEGTFRRNPFDAQTAMTRMPSGHFEVSVTEFAPGGWMLPPSAQEDFVESDFLLKGDGTSVMLLGEPSPPMAAGTRRDRATCHSPKRQRVEKTSKPSSAK